MEHYTLLDGIRVLKIHLCSINHVEMTLCALSPQHIPTILKMAPKVPTLKVLVSLDPIPEEEKKILSAWGHSVGIKVIDLEEGAELAVHVHVETLMDLFLPVEQLGKVNLKAITYPNKDAVSTICYTSVSQ